MRSSSNRMRVTRSLPLTGRCRMARSSWPLASCGSSPVVVPSTMTSRSLGWRWAAVVHQAGDQPPGGGADHAHPDGAGHLVLAGGHVGQQGVELGQDAPGPGHDHRTLLGQPAVGPVDQRRAQLLLEPGHVGRDVGLDGAEVLGGGRERTVVADGGERLEVSEFHRQ